MKVIVHSSNEVFTSIGHRYFLEKYGIISDMKEELPLMIVSDTHQSNFDTISGWAEFHNQKVPIFGELTDGEKIGGEFLFCSVGNRKIPLIFIRDEEIEITVTLFDQIGYCLTGGPDRITRLNKDLIISDKAIADFWGALLFDCLLKLYANSGKPLVRKSFWPYGKEFALCLTHDVDEVRKTYQWITSPIKMVRNFDFVGVYNQVLSFIDKIRGKEPYWTFQEIKDLEAKLGVRSSFYFLRETAMVDPLKKETWRHAGRKYSFDNAIIRILKTLHSEGWEIGLHGSFESYNNPFKIKIEKKLLEEALGDRVCGGRQHNLNLAIPDTWTYLEDAGLDYDTTLGFNDRIGFRWGLCFPFRPFHLKENRFINILEIPLIIEDIALFRYDNPWEEFQDIAEYVIAHHGVLTLLWHHTVFNKREFPGWASIYRRMIEYCAMKGAWSTTAREISCWWKKREGAQVEGEWKGNRLIIRRHSEIEGLSLTISLPQGLTVKNVSEGAAHRVQGEGSTVQVELGQGNNPVEIEFTGGPYGS